MKEFREQRSARGGCPSEAEVPVKDSPKAGTQIYSGDNVFGPLTSRANNLRVAHERNRRQDGPRV